jgi:hypothetical protein
VRKSKKKALTVILRKSRSVYRQTRKPVSQSVIPRNFPSEYSTVTESNIFYYFGHGSDICDPVTNKLKYAMVPEGSAYITVTQCGRGTYAEAETLTKEVFTSLVDIQNLLRKPRVLPKGYFFRTAFFQDEPFPEDNQRQLSVHRSGDLYVDNFFQPSDPISKRDQRLLRSQSGQWWSKAVV